VAQNKIPQLAKALSKGDCPSCAEPENSQNPNSLLTAALNKQ
jgi:hypothetical protein